MPKSLPLFTMTVTELLRTRNNSITGTVYALLRRRMREASVDHQFSIPNPKLWSPDSPSLYTAVTEVKVAGKVVDRYETVFGLRSFRWDSATGFI